MAGINIRKMMGINMGEMTGIIMIDDKDYQEKAEINTVRRQCLSE